MKVYLINLDRSPERLAWMREQCHGQDIEMVRVEAVDAKDLSEEEMDRLRSISSGRSSLSGPELACFLSHRKVWGIIASGEEPWAFVAEDDIHLSARFHIFLENSDWIPEGVDVVKAETVLTRQEVSRRKFGDHFGHHLHNIYSYHFGAAGYFISKSTSKRLLKYTENICEPVDELIFSPTIGLLRDLCVMQIIPAICIQDNYLNKAPLGNSLGSTISEERTRFRRRDPKSPRPKGLAKAGRELRRIGAQATGVLKIIIAVSLRRSVLKVIPFR